MSASEVLRGTTRSPERISTVRLARTGRNSFRHTSARSETRSEQRTGRSIPPNGSRLPLPVVVIPELRRHPLADKRVGRRGDSGTPLARSDSGVAHGPGRNVAAFRGRPSLLPSRSGRSRRGTGGG